MVDAVSGRVTEVVRGAGNESSSGTAGGCSDAEAGGSGLSTEASGGTSTGEEDFWTTGSSFDALSGLGLLSEAAEAMGCCDGGGRCGESSLKPPEWAGCGCEGWDCCSRVWLLLSCCCGGVGVEEGGPTGGVEFLLPEPPAMISSVMSLPP